MRQSYFKSASLTLLIFVVPAWVAGAGVDQAASKVEKAMDKLSHVLGTEKRSLKVLETEVRSGKPTLERGLDGVDRTERRTAYHPNGRIYSQETREFLGSSDVTTYVEKNVWDNGGKLLLQVRESVAFDNGVQTSGEGWQKDFKDGKERSEVKRRWTVETRAWVDFYKQVTAYYPNGEMKVRVTEDKDSKATSRETWGGRKADGGRDKSTQTWNGAAKRWDQP